MEAQSWRAKHKNPSDWNEAAIERAKLFFANAGIACFAVHRYECTLIDKEKLNGENMTAAERTSFMKAWYRAMTLVALENDGGPLPCHLIIPMDLLQFLIIMEVMYSGIQAQRAYKVQAS